jgi:hypothetical protein
LSAARFEAAPFATAETASAAIADKTAKTTRLNGIMSINLFILSSTALSFRANDPSF